MNRFAIWSETLLTTIAYASAIWAADRFIFSPLTTVRGVALALAFAAVQAGVIVIMLAALFLRKGLAARRAGRSARIRAEIQEALGVEAAGQDQLRRLRSLAARSRKDVEQVVEEFAGAVRGAAAGRIRAVAGELGIPLDDDTERVERLFARAASGNLLKRAATIEQLEPYAARLGEQQIPRALTSSDLSRVTAALDMIVAWKRLLPVGNLAPLLRHENADIRTRAMRALPFVERRDQTNAAVLAGLADPDPRVRVAAAEAAARLRIDAATPSLAGNLTASDRSIAIAAAFALASLPSGVGVLRNMVASGGAGSTAAFEALEKSTMQRLELP